MSALEFCEQCQVYHNTVLVDGYQAFTECQQGRPVSMSRNCLLISHKNITMKQHDASPISKTSFTSINYHLQPQQHNNNGFVYQKGSPVFVYRHLPPQHQTSMNLNQGVPQKPSSPPIQINLRPVINVSPARPVVNARTVQAKPSSPSFSLNMGKTLLSTIVQQKYDGTERSIFTSVQGSARQSKRPSMEMQRVPTQSEDLSLAEKYASARTTSDEVFSSPSKSYTFRKLKQYKIDNSHIQEQKNCWCW